MTGSESEFLFCKIYEIPSLQVSASHPMSAGAKTEGLRIAVGATDMTFFSPSAATPLRGALALILPGGGYRAVEVSYPRRP